MHACFAARADDPGNRMKFTRWFTHLRARSRFGPRILAAGGVLVGLGLAAALLAQDAAHPLDRVYAQYAGRPVQTADSGAVLRRLSLHLRGTIPGVQELEDFENTPEEYRQLRYSVAFMRDPAYAEYWGVYFASMFREKTEGWKLKYASFYQYLALSLHENKPYDQLVREMITATGGPEQNPAANFYLRDDGDALQTAEYVGRLLYGRRVACARCHDHPYDNFSRRDYYGLAAFFAQVYVEDYYPRDLAAALGGAGSEYQYLPWDRLENLPEEYRKGLQDKWNQWNRENWNKWTEDQRRTYRQRNQLPLRTVFYHPQQGIRFPRSDTAPGGDLVAPKFPDGSVASIPPGADRRAVFADWLVRQPRFRKVLINRLWTRLMGWSFFTPLDDLNDKTEIRGAAILDHLDEVFVKRGYRIKDLTLYIVTSDAYARAAPPAAGPEAERQSDTLYFQAQRMNPDQLMNSLIKGSQALKVGDIWERRIIPIDESGNLEDIDLAGMGAVRAPVPAQRDFSSSAEVERPAHYNNFLAVFGAGPRMDIADDDPTLTIEQVLTLMNGRLTGRLAWEYAGNDSFIKQAYDKNQRMEDAYNAVFRSLLTRNMSEAERTAIMRLTASRIGGRQNQGYNREALQDLLWSLFNSQEFLHVN